MNILEVQVPEALKLLRDAAVIFVLFLLGDGGAVISSSILAMSSKLFSWFKYGAKLDVGELDVMLFTTGPEFVSCGSTLCTAACNF